MGDRMVILSGISFILNMLCILTIIFYDKRKPAVTLAWILLLGSTSYFGFFVYLFFGMSFRKKRLTKSRMKKRNFTHVHLENKLESIQEEITESNREFIKFLAKHSGADLHVEGDAEIIVDGKNLYEEMFKSIKNAKDYIHLEYYIVQNDEAGRSLLKLLSEKAKEGIEVKFLYDGFGSRLLSKNFFFNLNENGGEALCFFPLTVPHLSLRANYRNHRKICIVDGDLAYIGGFNIGKEYLGESKLGYWRDTHLKISGNIINDIQIEFILDYEFAGGKEFDRKKYLKSRVKKETTVAMQLVSSGPNYESPFIKDAILKLISNAKKSIYIQTPYFIPDESIMDILKLLLISNIKVYIMIPNKPDHILVYSATKSYIGELLEFGAKCYIYENGFLHSKVIIVDDEIATVGTTNMDLRSFYLDFETNIFIYDKKRVQELKNQYIKDLKVSSLLTREIYESRTRVAKVKESISRLLSPIL